MGGATALREEYSTGKTEDTKDAQDAGKEGRGVLGLADKFQTQDGMFMESPGAEGKKEFAQDIFDFVERRSLWDIQTTARILRGVAAEMERAALSVMLRD